MAEREWLLPEVPLARYQNLTGHSEFLEPIRANREFPAGGYIYYWTVVVGGVGDEPIRFLIFLLLLDTRYWISDTRRWRPVISLFLVLRVDGLNLSPSREIGGRQGKKNLERPRRNSRWIIIIEERGGKLLKIKAPRLVGLGLGWSKLANERYGSSPSDSEVIGETLAHLWMSVKDLLTKLSFPARQYEDCIFLRARPLDHTPTCIWRVRLIESLCKTGSRGDEMIMMRQKIRDSWHAAKTKAQVLKANSDRRQLSEPVMQLPDGGEQLHYLGEEGTE
ncbi:hypothetical protein K474DRAFT_1694728 [Panus rudis PR-1116 ss-1]|nr:hypothetical protein K474DRAFT_1694728 [Panus rudis PR-1116 ss-1]